MESLTLAELQQRMATWIVEGRDVDLSRWVSVPHGVDEVARLAVYRDGYPARLHEAIVETFPAVAKILGEGSLVSMLERYRREIPTGWLNLNSVGRSLPAFLCEDRLADDLPFLPDLARFEWLVSEAFHAQLGEPFDFTTVSSWELGDWSAARVVFQPGVAIVSSQWPIHELRAVRERDRSEIDVDLVDRPESVWIYRHGFEVRTELLDAVEAQIAGGLLDGMTLGEAIGEVIGEAIGKTDVAGAAESQVLEMFSRFHAGSQVSAVV